MAKARYPDSPNSVATLYRCCGQVQKEGNTSDKLSVVTKTVAEFECEKKLKLW